MFKKILFSSCLFVMALTSFGQLTVPNGIFDTWTSQSLVMPNTQYQNPNQWVSLNQFIAFHNAQNQGDIRPFSVLQSSDADTGNFSVRIVSVDISGLNPLPGIIKDTAGVLFCGTADIQAGTIDGFPISKAYEELSFKYKYTGVNQDSAYVNIVFFKYDNVTNSTVTIANGEMYFGDAGSYTEIIVPMEYLVNNIVPDTATIFFSATKFFGSNSIGNPEAGSELFLDNVKFKGDLIPSGGGGGGGGGGGSGVGISQNETNDFKISVFPNPANEKLNIKTSELSEGNILIIDFTGREVSKVPLTRGIATIETMNLESSIYFIKILNEENEVKHIRKVVISHL